MARARALMPQLGITRVANVTGLDTIGIPVVMVCRPNSRSLAVSQGKGIDLDSAKASGLMESIELFHAERIARPVILSTLEDLLQHSAAVDVARLPRLALGAFDHRRRLPWIAAVDLAHETTKYVPYEMVHTNYTLPLPEGSGCFVMSSNGLASGNDKTEATVHALCELIERDANCLWFECSPEERAQTRVDQGSIDDPVCCELLEAFDRAGVAVGIWETTTDIGIPSFFALVVERRHDRLRLLYPTHGMGCHPVRAIALSRALTEAAQSRLTLISGSRDDVSRERYRTQQSATAWDQAQELLRDRSSRAFRDAPSFPEATQALLIERLEAVGLSEVAVVDLSDARWGIAVVRAIVPGLEPPHDSPRSSRGERFHARLRARGNGS
ncbi:MAG TPA: YcaO-like family protein [Polyangiaceae bacterium]|nr:YcaO-like family protein [Polyangiaceae bacterium]